MRGHRLSFGSAFLLGSIVTLGAFGALGACTSAGDYVVVTVDARPAVHDARSIAVALTNAGSTRTDRLALGDRAFPVTFSISAPDRTGDLAIAIEAADENGLVVGRGSATTKVGAAGAKVTLDPADFVVNTDYAGDQFPSDDFEGNGFQLAALPDGTWTAGFRDSCMQSSCNVFARRFDKAGRPVATAAAAGTNAFVVTARPTDLLAFTTPAVASSQTATVAMWSFADVAPSTATGIACRAIDARGALGADRSPISTDSFGSAVSVVALPSGDFVASWNAIPADSMANVVRAAIVKPDCSAPGEAETVSAAGVFADRNAVASSADHVMLTWVMAGDLHARMASTAGVFAPGEAVLVRETATDRIAHARIAPASGGGFVVAVRWIPQSGSTSSGRIDLLRVDATGALVGAPTLVSDQTGNDLFSSESFGLASRPDGTVMVAWHVCNPSGDTCSVSGRILKYTGEPLTDSFAIPTTAGGSQKQPSVVGLPDAFAVVWSDTSGKPPDTAGQAVRARIIYPP